MWKILWRKEKSDVIREWLRRVLLHRVIRQVLSEERTTELRPEQEGAKTRERERKHESVSATAKLWDENEHTITGTVMSMWQEQMEEGISGTR